MKARDVVNWIVEYSDYTIPICAFFAGILIGMLL